MKPAGAGRVLALVAAWLTACAVAPARVAQEPSIGTALVGVWCNSTDGGASCWAYDEFRGDGSFEACGRTEDDTRPFHGEGRYSVEGRRMCYRVTRASPNFWLRAGDRYCTDIVAIGPTSHRYRDIDSGAEFELSRVPAGRKRCPPAR